MLYSVYKAQVDDSASSTIKFMLHELSPCTEYQITNKPISENGTYADLKSTTFIAGVTSPITENAIKKLKVIPGNIH